LTLSLAISFSRIISFVSFASTRKS